MDCVHRQILRDKLPYYGSSESWMERKGENEREREKGGGVEGNKGDLS